LPLPVLEIVMLQPPWFPRMTGQLESACGERRQAYPGICDAPLDLDAVALNQGGFDDPVFRIGSLWNFWHEGYSAMGHYMRQRRII
jgi:hypothetical protein